MKERRYRLLPLGSQVHFWGPAAYGLRVEVMDREQRKNGYWFMVHWRGFSGWDTAPRYLKDEVMDHIRTCHRAGVLSFAGYRRDLGCHVPHQLDVQHWETVLRYLQTEFSSPE